MPDDACRVFWKDSYGTELWVPTMGNQGSTGYPFSCQLSGLCPDYGATLVVFSCGAVVFSCQSLAACPGSVPGVLDRGTGHARYSSKTHALHWQAVTTTITLFDMWENGCGMGHS